MSKSNAFETAFLELMFKNTAAANIGDASGLQPSGAAGVFYISLHTANPGDGGAQNTSEATYTGYARVSVARSGAGWTVTGDTASNAALVSFPACTGGSDTITHFGIGSDASGVGNLFFWGALTAPLNVSSGVTPQFTTGNLTVVED